MRRLVGVRRDVQMIQTGIAQTRRADQKSVAAPVNVAQTSGGFQWTAYLAQPPIAGHGDRQTPSPMHHTTVGQHEKHPCT